MKKLFIILSILFMSATAMAKESSQNAPKIYLAAKAGSMSSTLKDMYGNTLDSSGTTAGGAVGFYIANQARFEIEYLRYAEITNGYYTRNSSSVLANIYFDLGKSTVRPYIGAGIGIAFAEEETPYSTWSEVAPAIAVHLGTSINFNKNTAFDISGRVSFFDKTQDTKIEQAVLGVLAAFRLSF